MDKIIIIMKIAQKNNAQCKFMSIANGLMTLTPKISPHITNLYPYNLLQSCNRSTELLIRSYVFAGNF